MSHSFWVFILVSNKTICKFRKLNKTTPPTRAIFKKTTTYPKNVTQPKMLWWVQKNRCVFLIFVSFEKKLGGGFKDFFFTPILGEDEPILTTHMFQMGWWKTTNQKFLLKRTNIYTNLLVGICVFLEILGLAIFLPSFLLGMYIFTMPKNRDRIPIFREYLLGLGVNSVSKESIGGNFRRGPGASVAWRPKISADFGHPQMGGFESNGNPRGSFRKIYGKWWNMISFGQDGWVFVWRCSSNEWLLVGLGYDKLGVTLPDTESFCIRFTIWGIITMVVDWWFRNPAIITCWMHKTL